MKSLHHSFDIEIAEKYGIEEAIIIHHFQHWIGVNKRLKRNKRDGRYWSYQSLDEIAAHFPYWDSSKIYEIICRLVEGKARRGKKQRFDPVLLKGNFNKNRYDNTSWYAFVDEEKFVFQKDSTALANAKKDDGNCQSRNCEVPKPIPDTKTDTETEVPSLLPSEKKDKSFFSSVSQSVTPRAKKEMIERLKEEYDEETISIALEKFKKASEERSIDHPFRYLLKICENVVQKRTLIQEAERLGKKGDLTNDVKEERIAIARDYANRFHDVPSVNIYENGHEMVIEIDGKKKSLPFDLEESLWNALLEQSIPWDLFPDE